MMDINLDEWDEQRHPKCPIKCDIEDIKVEIEQIVDEEKADDEKWSRGLYYALKVIDKHIKENKE